MPNLSVSTNSKSLNLTANNASYAVSASYAQTASLAQNIVSASYAVTASYALNGGGGGGETITLGSNSDGVLTLSDDVLDLATTPNTALGLIELDENGNLTLASSLIVVSASSLDNGAITTDGSGNIASNSLVAKSFVNVGFTGALPTQQYGPLIVNADVTQAGGKGMYIYNSELYGFNIAVSTEFIEGVANVPFLQATQVGITNDTPIAFAPDGGNVLIGTLIDDGEHLLQVNGNASINGSLTVSGALPDGTYTCGTGQITLTNGVITAIS